MKLKYVLDKNEENQLTIGEFSALDKKESEIYTLLYEERYSGEVVKAAIQKGQNTLLSVLRTPNLYPPEVYANKLMDMVVQMYAHDKSESQEVVFDDYDLLVKVVKGKPAPAEEIDDELEEDAIELDDLLDDDDDDIKNIKTSIQVADDEIMDIDKDDEDSSFIL